MDTIAKVVEHQIGQSWCFKDIQERRFRIGILERLFLELNRIRTINRFSTRLGEAAIESVITGDWASVLSLAEHLTFSDECQQIKDEYAPLWAGFVTILRSSYAEATLI